MENVGSSTAAPTITQLVLTGHVHSPSVGKVTQQQREIQSQIGLVKPQALTHRHQMHLTSAES